MTHDILGRCRQKALSGLRRPSLPSLRDLLIWLGFVTGSASVGAIAWSGNLFTLPVAVLLPTLWAFAPNRLVAGLVSLAYFLAASRGLPVGVATYYASDIWLGLGLWFAASCSFVAVHAALWSPKAGWQRPLRYLAVGMLMSVPPFGIVGWASPITAAGVMFPGWSWLGLVVTGFGLSAMTTRFWPATVVVFAIAYGFAATNWSDPNPPEGWVGIDTTFNYQSAGQYADYTQQIATIGLVRRAAENGAERIVLPESALGTWTPTTERLWIRNLADLDVVVAGGAIVLNATGYDNVMVEVSGEGARILYRERMPAPVSMWRPWASGGATAQIFGNPTGSFAGASIAPLICYEQLVVWPVVQSMLFHPEVIVATGNGWWTHGTNIVAIQEASIKAWASLFGLPLVFALNA